MCSKYADIYYGNTVIAFISNAGLKDVTWLMSLSIELRTSMHIIGFITLTHIISVISVRKLFTLLAPGDTINIVNVLNYKSTLKQYRCRHVSQRLFKCFHGGCYRSYKHPQDLSRHTATHQQITFECDLCDKTFKQKRLLKHHEAVNTNAQPYVCPHCDQCFKHNN